MGRLGFRVGVSASYSYFRRVRNFDFVYTAAVSVPLAFYKYISNSMVNKNPARAARVFNLVID